MGHNPWVQAPETARIELEWRDGETVRPLWLTVRKHLSAGESRAMLAGVTSVTQPVARTRTEKPAAATAKMEWADYSFARMVAYIVDWSVAHDPEPSFRLPPVRQSYESLPQSLFALIDDALDAHEQAMGAEGKATAGSPAPEAILAS